MRRSSCSLSKTNAASIAAWRIAASPSRLMQFIISRTIRLTSASRPGLDLTRGSAIISAPPSIDGIGSGVAAITKRSASCWCVGAVAEAGFCAKPAISKNAPANTGPPFAKRHSRLSLCAVHSSKRLTGPPPKKDLSRSVDARTILSGPPEPEPVANAFCSRHLSSPPCTGGRRGTKPQARLARHRLRRLDRGLGRVSNGNHRRQQPVVQREWRGGGPAELLRPPNCTRSGCLFSPSSDRPLCYPGAAESR
jgi:hypothetical protein